MLRCMIYLTEENIVKAFLVQRDDEDLETILREIEGKKILKVFELFEHRKAADRLATALFDASDSFAESFMAMLGNVVRAMQDPRVLVRPVE
jgi:hypothetical protein